MDPFPTVGAVLHHVTGGRRLDGMDDELAKRTLESTHQEPVLWWGIFSELDWEERTQLRQLLPWLEEAMDAYDQQVREQSAYQERTVGGVVQWIREGRDPHLGGAVSHQVAQDYPLEKWIELFTDLSAEDERRLLKDELPDGDLGEAIFHVRALFNAYKPHTLTDNEARTVGVVLARILPGRERFLTSVDFHRAVDDMSSPWWYILFDGLSAEEKLWLREGDLAAVTENEHLRAAANHIRGLFHDYEASLRLDSFSEDRTESFAKDSVGHLMMRLIGRLPPQLDPKLHSMPVGKMKPSDWNEVAKSLSPDELRKCSERLGRKDNLAAKRFRRAIHSLLLPNASSDPLGEESTASEGN